MKRAAWCALVACLALAGFTLHRGEWAVVRVGGGSMQPALWPGDVCVVRAVDRLADSDVALFIPPGHTGRVLHRIRSRRPDGLVMQGDANPVADREPVPLSAVAGRVEAVLPVGRALRRWQAILAR